MQRRGIPAAQAQALKSPLAQPPFPVATVSQAPDQEFFTRLCWLHRSAAAGPEKGSIPASQELPACPSHTEVCWGHLTLPLWSGCFRPGKQPQEESRQPVMLLCVLHILTRTKGNLAGCYFTEFLLFLYRISIFLSLCLFVFWFNYHFSIV